jgi:hypothetical protein
MKQNTAKYRDLISRASMHEYYATCPTNGLSELSRMHWANSAAELRKAAEEIPEDFVDPQWQMPEWGTRGT